MVEQAVRENTDPLADYELADVTGWQPEAPVDVMVSNALFQWVPDRLAQVERLAGHVAAGGTFALQVPDSDGAPSHRLLHELSSGGPYAEHTAGLHEDRGTEAHTWLELFTRMGWQVDAWTTTYLHVLPGEDPVLSWISGTGARPILAALPEELRADFVAEYGAALREAYPRREWGTVLPFQRVFAVATRPAAPDR